MPAPVRVRTTDGDGDGRSLLIQTGWWKRGNFRRRQREVTLSNFREINDDDGHNRVCADVHRVLRRLRSSHTAAAASARGAGPSSFFRDPFRTFRPTGTEIFGIVPLFFLFGQGVCVVCSRTTLLCGPRRKEKGSGPTLTIVTSGMSSDQTLT